MQRKFLKNLVFLVILNLLIKPFWLLGIDRAVQNSVGTADYGFYFAVFNFSFLFNILLDLGITNFNNKNIAQNNHLLNKHLSRIIVLKILLFFLYLIFTFGGAFIIDYSREQMYILAFLGINQFLLSFILYLRSNLGGLHLFVTDSLMSVLDRSLMIVICGALLWGNIVGEFKIEYFVYAQTAAYLISSVTGLFMLLRKTRIRLFRLKLNWLFFTMVLKQSLPFALLVLLMAFYSRIDSIMLERLLSDGAKHVGIYASAFRLLDAFNMMSYLFAVLLLPIFAKMIKLKQSVEALSRLSFTLIMIPALIITAGAFQYSNEIMELLYVQHIDESAVEYAIRMEASAKVFSVLMLCFCATSSTYIFGTLMTANGNLKQLNIISVCGVVLNISINFWLIPFLQAYGSAIASMYTQFLVAALQIYFVKKIFNFRMNYLLIFKLLFFIIGVILISWFSSMLSYEWFINFLIMVISGVLLSFALRLINIRELAKIVKYGE